MTPQAAGWQRDLAIGNERLGDIYARQGKRQEETRATIKSRVFSVVPLWWRGVLKGKQADLEAAPAIL